MFFEWEEILLVEIGVGSLETMTILIFAVVITVRKDEIKLGY
jgi:hypothetical protein